MTTIANAEKVTGRNFYAVKENSKGKAIPYAFAKIAERNAWVKQNEEGNAKPVSAFEVYKLMQRTASDALIANRQGRVIKVSEQDEVFPEKGQRLLLKS